MIIWDRIWIAIVGLAFIGLGLVVNDFRWGLRPTGPPAPTWIGRLWFIGLGLALILAAIFLHSH
jgi:hypothetical protein